MLAWLVISVRIVASMEAPEDDQTGMALLPCEAQKLKNVQVNRTKMSSGKHTNADKLS